MKVAVFVKATPGSEAGTLPSEQLLAGMRKYNDALALSCESREEAARMVDAALTAGSSRVGEPKDYGFMIQDGFQDLNGHIWEFSWMDPNHVIPNA